MRTSRLPIVINSEQPHFDEAILAQGVDPLQSDSEFIATTSSTLIVQICKEALRCGDSQSWNEGGPAAKFRKQAREAFRVLHGESPVPEHLQHAACQRIGGGITLQLDDHRLFGRFVEYQEISTAFRFLVPAAIRQLPCQDAFVLVGKVATLHEHPLERLFPWRPNPKRVNVWYSGSAESFQFGPISKPIPWRTPDIRLHRCDQLRSTQPRKQRKEILAPLGLAIPISNACL